VQLPALDDPKTETVTMVNYSRPIGFSSSNPNDSASATTEATPRTKATSNSAGTCDGLQENKIFF
jgi:hypothetical protein